MAKIPGTNVASPIAPFTTDDQFPTHDAIYGKGGQREVATIAERDAIPLARLTEGCTCYVAATEKTYRWKSNAWVDDTPEIASDASDISYTPSGSGSTPTNVAAALNGKASTSALTEGLAGKQGTINDLEAIRSGAGKGATSVQGVKMEGDDEPLSPGVDGVVTIPQPEIPDAVTSVLANNELVFQTPDGQSVKGKVGISTGADGLLHLTLTDEEGNTYSSPIAGLRVVGNALQYSNDGETWTTAQTFGKLAIKYAQASDPASGDEGDLALVGSTNAYVLKVYVGGSWVSVCDFGKLDLTSDGITIVGENKTLTEKIAELNTLKDIVEGTTATSAVNLNDASLSTGYSLNGNNRWNAATAYVNTLVIPIPTGMTKVTVQSNASYAESLVFLKSLNGMTTANTLADTTGSVVSIAKNTERTLTIPSNAVYMAYNYRNSSYKPRSIVFSVEQKGLEEKVEELMEATTSASEVSFNNTTSGLNAETVQAAIDEVVGDVDTMINGHLDDVENLGETWTSGSFWNGVNGATESNSNYSRCEVDVKALVGSVIDIYAYRNGGTIYRVKKNGTILQSFTWVDQTYWKHCKFTVQDDDDLLRVSNDSRSVANPYLTIQRYHAGVKDDVESLEGRVDSLENAAQNKRVDLIMFMGQSNMAGRGITSETWPKDAPSVPDGVGYEFRAITDPTRLYGVTKTFGVTENLSGAIDDTNPKTGGLVPSFMNAYYNVSNTPIVGVSASEGGTTAANWAPNGARLNDAINRLNTAVAWLTENGYTILHKYMAWCQGETDGDRNTSADVKKANYKAEFIPIFNAMKAAGIEKCFMIRIGEYNGVEQIDYGPIILAQNEICQENEDVVMVSTSFASMKARGLMKDTYHYYQEGYNQVGEQAGYWAAVYRQYHREGVMYDVKTGELYFTQWSY